MLHYIFLHILLYIEKFCDFSKSTHHIFHLMSYKIDLCGTLLMLDVIYLLVQNILFLVFICVIFIFIANFPSFSYFWYTDFRCLSILSATIIFQTSSITFCSIDTAKISLVLNVMLPLQLNMSHLLPKQLNTSLFI